MLEITPPRETPLSLIRTITGDPRWHASDHSPVPYQTYLRLEPKEPDLSFYAAIHGLHAVATRVQPTSAMTRIVEGQIQKESLARAFELENQWQGEPRENRSYLRVVVNGDQDASGTRLSLFVICDQWGNALRDQENQSKIRTAMAIFRARTQQTGTAPGPRKLLPAGI